jgi:pectate disaccharide-lyase
MLKSKYIGLAMSAVLVGSLTARADIRDTIQSASSGTTVTCSGTYTVSARITVPSGVTVSGGTFKFTTGSSADGFYIPSGNHGVTLTGVTVQGANHGIMIYGYANTINSCIAQYNYNSGIEIIGSAAKNNVIKYCQGKYNADSSGGNADGFAAKNSTSTGNQFLNCDAHGNSDDGFDYYSAASPIVTKNSKAYSNGYYNGKTGNGVGIKMGGSGYSASHSFTSCTAYSNTAGQTARGFDSNNNGSKLYLTTCKSYSNKNTDRLVNCSLSSCTMQQ